MKKWDIFFKGVLLIMGLTLIAINFLLYNSFEEQKIVTANINKQQQVQAQVNDNKFKYQEDKIDQMNKDLQGALQQVKDQADALAEQKDSLAAQKDALLQEVEKRQQIENDSKSIQTSLVDIKAEADAIKLDMKTWQKDYVTVLAQLEKKMDDSQAAIKENVSSLKTDVEKEIHQADNNAPNINPTPVKKSENPPAVSQ